MKRLTFALLALLLLTPSFGQDVFHRLSDGTYAYRIYSSGGTFSVTLPAANLGSQLSAASLSVVSASDATWHVTPLGSVSLLPAVIADGQSLSAAVQTGGKPVVGLIMPAAGWETATTLTFQACTDASTCFDLYDQSGAEVTVTVPVAGNVFVRLSPANWAAIQFLKVRSGTAASAVVQNGGDIITVITRSM